MQGYRRRQSPHTHSEFTYLFMDCTDAFNEKNSFPVHHRGEANDAGRYLNDLIT